jgi:GT2 family glycosyltransferase
MTFRGGRVVVVVLNWCGENDTIACIESLRRSSYPDLSILIVDNASADGSGERLHSRFPDFAYLQTGENLGYAGGNNRAFELALAGAPAYVLVLNNDTVVDTDCIAALVHAAERTGAAVVAPKIVYFDDPSRLWYAGGDFSARRALGVHRLEGALDHPSMIAAPVTFVTGCCFLIRSDVLRTVGGFDESYFAYVEDAELSVRVAAAGHAMMFEPAARVLHRIPLGRPRDTPFQIRQRDRNRRRLVRTHFGLGRRLVFAAWFYPTRAIHLLRYVATAAWPEARAIVSGAFGSLERPANGHDVQRRPGSVATAGHR